MTNFKRISSSSSAIKNPFVVESPEKISPKQIIELFIEKFTYIETLKQRKHTIVWGTRGAGKSMMFRYLEPQCQATVAGSMEIFLKKENMFLAVYCPCKEGQINRTDLQLFEKNSSLVITEHMMNLVVAERLINCLKTQFKSGFFPNKAFTNLAEEILQLYDKAAISSSLQEVRQKAKKKNDPLGWLQDLFTAENRRVCNYLRLCSIKNEKTTYDGATSGYHDFLLPMMRAVQKLPKLDGIPIYIMLDDADRLAQDQQSIFNTWIANRDQSTICLKISALPEGYKTFFTRDGGLIEQPHDYSEIDVEELYTRSKSDYFEKVKLIAERRLELSNLKTKNIKEFLPFDPTEQKLLEEFKKDTGKEWETKGRPGRQGDYVTRYATARLFQHLKKTKKRKSYAGFENVVHLSSGVVRDFLEPCYLMFDKCVSEGSKSNAVDKIPPSLQDEVLFKYSEEFVLQKFERIRKVLPTERWAQVDLLQTLIASLGKLFFERLHDAEAREARLFSFTLRGQPPPELVEVLRLGVIQRYFQLRTYSSKEGGGREKWYILNRRVCPVYKLDPSGFEGRISLTPAHLKLACQDPEKFVRLRLKQEKQDKEPSLFSLDESISQ